MIAVPTGVRVLVATRPVDFRRGADSLAAVVREELRQNPFCGTIFVFRSKAGGQVEAFGLGRVRAGAVLEAVGAGCVPLAADQRWGDAALGLAARRAN